MIATPLAVVLVGGGCAALTATIFAVLQIPLGWILGAMVGGAVATNFLPPIKDPKKIRRLGQLLIGVAASSVLTPEILKMMLHVLPAMIVGALGANLVGLILAWPFFYLAKTDKTTAVLACLPAGMAEMASLANDLGARTDVVTLTHTIRVLLVVIFVPIMVGVTKSDLQLVIEVQHGTSWALLVCLIGGCVLAMAASRFGFLNAYIMAPMVIGVILTSAGIQVPTMHANLLILAQILIGYSLGVRLKSDSLKRKPRTALAAAICSVLLILGMALVVAPLIMKITEVDKVSAVLGLAPGGLGEMIAAAKMTSATVGIVVGFQFIRSFMTNMIVPQIIVRLLRP